MSTPMTEAIIRPRVQPEESPRQASVMGVLMGRKLAEKEGC